MALINKVFKGLIIVTQETELKRVNESLININNNIGQLGRELSENQTSTRGLWHSYAEINKKVGNLPEQIRKTIRDHEDDCYARERVKQKAIGSDSSTAIPKINTEQKSQLSIPKWAIYTAAFMGAALIGAGLFIGAVLFSNNTPAQVLQDLGTKAAKSQKIIKK